MNKKKDYDVFISYRREGGKEIARPLKSELELRGFRVFLDFDELKDGKFDQRIMDAIDDSPIFMVILSPHALDRCVNDGDWVRKEIEYALEKGCHIIPIDPDRTFTGFPESISEQLKVGLGQHQFSEVMLGQLFKASVDKMVEERVRPVLERIAEKCRIQEKEEAKKREAERKTKEEAERKAKEEAERKRRDASTYTEHVEGIDIEFVRVEGGSFQMGSNNCSRRELPVHTVTLSDYYIGKYEVTQAQWEAVMGNNPSCFKGDNLPVENVSWEDACAFCRELSRITKRTYRLPTEAEWEYAARGGHKSEDTTYSGSEAIDRVAWYEGNSGKRTHPVGTKASNALGLYDMTGNVEEWCSDWSDDDYYKQSPVDNPKGPNKGRRWLLLFGPFRVIRGGDWNSNASWCHVAHRGASAPTNCFDYVGFRLVLEP